MGLFLWFSSKEYACKVGDVGEEGWVSGLGKSPG